MTQYKLVVTNKSTDYNLSTGLVYQIDCDNSIEQTNPIGIFTLELTQFPNIKSGLLGSSFVTKYEYQINLDRPNEVFGELFTNSDGLSVTGTYKLNSGTFMNLSPLGMPFGKYINQATNVGYSSIFSKFTGYDNKVIMNIEKNDSNGYECIVII